MEFEWDPEKSEATFALRGFDFAFAAGIFAGRVIEAVARDAITAKPASVPSERRRA